MYIYVCIICDPSTFLVSSIPNLLPPPHLSTTLYIHTHFAYSFLSGICISPMYMYCIVQDFATFTTPPGINPTTPSSFFRHSSFWEGSLLRIMFQQQQFFLSIVIICRFREFCFFLTGQPKAIDNGGKEGEEEKRREIADNKEEEEEEWMSLPGREK